MAIPQTLHQIWWNWDAHEHFDDVNVGVPFGEFRQQWVYTHPHYTHRLWRRPASYAYVQEHFPQWMPTFLALPRHIQRCDMFRLLLLIHEGGIYSDVDLYPKVTLDVLTQRYPHGRLFLSTEGMRSAQRMAHAVSQSADLPGCPAPRQQALTNAWMVAEAGHPLLDLVLHEIRARIAWPLRRHAHVLFTSGPEVLTEVVHRAAGAFNDVVVLSKEETDAIYFHDFANSWSGLDSGPRTWHFVAAGLVYQGVVQSMTDVLPDNLERAAQLLGALQALPTPRPAEQTLAKLLRIYAQVPLEAAGKLELMRLRIKQTFARELGALSDAESGRAQVLQEACDKVHALRMAALKKSR